MTGATGGREELRPRVRPEAIADDRMIVVRGGPDNVVSLARHARRTNRGYLLDGEPVWGVSVMAALDDIGPASLTGILAGRMATYPTVHTPTAGRLIVDGFDLLPTFGRPHVTVRLASADQGELERLLAALGPAQPNPYHGGHQPRRR